MATPAPAAPAAPAGTTPAAPATGTPAAVPATKKFPWRIVGLAGLALVGLIGLALAFKLIFPDSNQETVKQPATTENAATKADIENAVLRKQLDVLNAALTAKNAEPPPKAQTRTKRTARVEEENGERRAVPASEPKKPDPEVVEMRKQLSTLVAALTAKAVEEKKPDPEVVEMRKQLDDLKAALAAKAAPPPPPPPPPAPQGLTVEQVLALMRETRPVATPAPASAEVPTVRSLDYYSRRDTRAEHDARKYGVRATGEKMVVLDGVMRPESALDSNAIHCTDERCGEPAATTACGCKNHSQPANNTCTSSTSCNSSNSFNFLNDLLDITVVGGANCAPTRERVIYRERRAPPRMSHPRPPPRCDPPRREPRPCPPPRHHNERRRR